MVYYISIHKINNLTDSRITTYYMRHVGTILIHMDSAPNISLWITKNIFHPRLTNNIRPAFGDAVMQKCVHPRYFMNYWLYFIVRTSHAFYSTWITVHCFPTFCTLWPFWVTLTRKKIARRIVCPSQIVRYDFIS